MPPKCEESALKRNKYFEIREELCSTNKFCFNAAELSALKIAIWFACPDTP
jgi:hypothetical protein